jgi:xanthine dehydrogenase accessory factor
VVAAPGEGRRNVVSLKPSDIYEEIARMHRDGVAGVVATVVAVGGSTPRGAGAKMIVYPDGRTIGTVGGGAIESTVIEKARGMPDGEPALLSFDLENDTDMICGGKMDIFLEPVAPGPLLIVAGGGHVGQAVGRAARSAGFRVTVIDDRADVVTQERFPFADRRLVGGIELLGDEVVTDGETFVVVVTRGHRFDRDWVEAFVDRWPLYLGMIGSATKVARTFEEMERNGVPSEALAKVHAPIGLDIGAETPEEIAVSVVAEMIAVRHGVSDTAMLKDKPEFKGRNRA